MATALQLAEFADRLLGSRVISDYPNAVNGLQVDTDQPVAALAAAVDFSSRSVKGAIKAGANLLIVHHGAFWGGAEPLTGARYRTFRLLIENSLGVYSSHLPLDCHPSLGNNVLLAETLGLKVGSSFGFHKGTAIGVAGDSKSSLSDLTASISSFAQAHSGRIHHTPAAAGRLVGRWAICTGAGADADTLREARERKIETLIVGEGAHWTAVDAEENDIVIVYAGHYATETLGVQALAKTLAAEFKIPWHFIPTPTGT